MDVPDRPENGTVLGVENIAVTSTGTFWSADEHLAVHPGRDIKYVVVDDGETSGEWVSLAHEDIDSFDPSYYETQLVRAVESVLSPLDWDRSDIRRELAETRLADLAVFSGADTA